MNFRSFNSILSFNARLFLLFLKSSYYILLVGTFFLRNKFYVYFLSFILQYYNTLFLILSTIFLLILYYTVIHFLRKDLYTYYLNYVYYKYFNAILINSYLYITTSIILFYVFNRLINFLTILGMIKTHFHLYYNYPLIILYNDFKNVINRIHNILCIQYLFFFSIQKNYKIL